MGQLGHDGPRMTLAVYAQVLKRSRIDHELVWSLMRWIDEPEDWSTPGPRIGPTGEAGDTPRREGVYGEPGMAHRAGVSDDGRGGFRTCDLSRVKQRGSTRSAGLLPAKRRNSAPPALRRMPLDRAWLGHVWSHE